MNEEILDARFHALADKTRRAIVARLARGDAAISELSAPFDMSLAAISKHLDVLEDAGIVARRKEGRVRICSLQPRALTTTSAWLDRTRADWEGRLDRLERMFEEDSA